MTTGQAKTPSMAFLRTHWGRLLQGATWIMATVGNFVFQPPGLTADDTGKIESFATFVITAFLGLIMIWLYRWRNQSYTMRWWSLGAVMLALSIITYFTYDNYIGKWTEPCVSTRVVIGSKWNPKLEQVRDQYRYEKTIEDFGCDATMLWNKDELDQRRRVLARIYMICVSLCAVTITTIVQAIDCMTRQPEETGTATE